MNILKRTFGFLNRGKGDDKDYSNTPSNILNQGGEEQKIEERDILHQADIPPGLVKQRHLQTNSMIIFRGLAADIPDGSTQVKAYFSTDSGELNIWDDSAWLTTTLS